MTQETRSPHARRPQAVIYLRVSTDRQAANEISLADQEKQLRKACEARGYDVADVFSEAESAYNGKRRPEFDRFLDLALSPERPFDVLFVHSLSRFARDTLFAERSYRDLERAGVQLVSLTENIEGESGWMLRQIISMFNEQSSRETSKHVKRTRIENALQGFWNGGRPPIGLKAEDAAHFGDKVKRQLVVDPEWSPMVKLIFKLHREGDGEGHALGVTGIAGYLNRQGYRTPTGALWHVSAVHKILTNEAYIGKVWMNRKEQRTGKLRPKDEWIYSPAPPLVSVSEFEETQLRLKDRRPKHRAPRTTTSDVVLGGLAHCGGCGGPMIAATGTSKTGAVYNYYACANRVRSGTMACLDPQRIRRDELDKAVLDAISRELLEPTRLQQLHNEVVHRRRAGQDGAAQELAAAKAALATTNKDLANLLTAVIKGTLAESSSVRQMQIDLETEKAKLTLAIKLRTAKLQRALKPIALAEAERLSTALREAMHFSPPPLVRRYASAIVQRVEVSGNQITVSGFQNTLVDAVSESGLDISSVQTSEREWRTERDSNPR